MARRVSVRRAAVAVIITAIWAGLAPSPAAAGPAVDGAGSTWVQIALDQWRADVASRGLTINYQGVGSSAGRQFFIIDQVDFAASEIPFLPNEVAQLQGKGKSWQYLPDVAGGTSFMYNLRDATGKRITDLRLSGPTIAKIFTGGITNWSDPAITADYGKPLAPQNITPVIRSDGSGTSAQFSLYLAEVTPSIWNPFTAQYGCPAPCSYWPNFPGSTAQRGSDGVANFVANDAIGKGSINYVEYGYATQRGFPVVAVKNKSGNFTTATPNNVATALTHANLYPDLTQNLSKVYTAPESNAYPISSYSYLITETTGFDPAKGNVLGQWLIYIACEGQQESALLGYSPLPQNLVEAVFDAVRRIPGAPAPPPLSQCDNPTINHEGGGNDNAGNDNAGNNNGGSDNAGSDNGDETPTDQPSASATDPFAGALDPLGAGASSALPSGVEVLPPDDQAEYRAAALASIDQAEPGPDLVFVLAALAAVVVVFGPALTYRRRRRRGGGRSG
jgi:phosphate ABC transporter phosphate-binding protein